MQKLNGLDEMFLAYDTPTTTGNMGGFAVLEPSEDPGSGRVDRMRERIADRLDYLPPLRWRLQPSPLVGHRFWLDSGRVDLQEHVFSLTLPPPGTDEQLAAEVSRLTQHPLRRDRPLWRFYVIDGLSNGRVAHLLKMSHGLGDGTAQARVFDILSDHPQQPLVYDPPPRLPEPMGGPAELAVRAAADLLAAPARAVRLTAHLAGWLAGRADEDGVLTTVPAAVARALPGELGRPLAALVNRRSGADRTSPVAPAIPTLLPPRSLFNARLSPRFQFEFADVPLADFRRAGNAAGGTINDAVLAVCAGALRRYLLDHGGIPEEPLVSSSPISFRRGDETEPWANYVYPLFVPIPTHVEDPLERLHWAHRSATVAKDNWQAGVGGLIRDIMGFVPGQGLVVGMQALARRPDGAPGLPFNVSLSNIKGSPVPQYYTGARMLGFWPVPFLMPGVAIMLVLQSYQDRLNVGIAACPDVVPDLRSLVTFIEQSLAELLDAELLDAELFDAELLDAPGLSATEPPAERAKPNAESSKSRAR